MDLASALGWLEKFVQWIVVPFASGLAGAAIAVRLQERARARRQHLADIKAKVLEPVRRRLEQFYLPLLDGTVGPVALENVSVPVKGSVTEPHRTWAWQLGPRRTIGNPFPWFGSEQEEPPQLSAELYADAKRRHYQDLLARWEALEREVVDGYVGTALGHAAALVTAIAERSELPRFEGGPMEPGTSWINAKALAVFVLDSRFGTPQAPPFIRPDRRSIDVYSHTVVQAETEEELKRVLGVLEELVQDSQPAQELRQRAAPLARQAKRLLRELNELIHSSRLPGHCRFAKV